MSTAHLQPDPTYMATTSAEPIAAASAVSWAAILAGGAAAAAISLILVMLGAGLGFSSTSPWADQGASATTLGISTILWLTLTSLVASGLGGYLAGRLRVRWHRTHVDEVYFRDTAHGFLAWAVATLVTAAVLTSTIGSIAGSGVKAGASVIGAAGSAAVTAGGAAASRSGESSGMSYYVDSLFRKDASATNASSTSGGDTNASASTGEVTRIFAQSLRTGSLAPEDQQYVAQMVAQRTGLSSDDANKRVGDLFAKTKAAADDAATKAKEAADTARKTAAYGALWLFISLLIGAFAASFAATLGGKQRDL